MPHGILYIVATPIGNLEDITIRAIRILKEVDFIACEDTSVTCKLLNANGIRNNLLIYNDHTSQKNRDNIINYLIQGNNIALVSDAGTPLISDPGYKLVREAWQSNIQVVPIPGASSILASLTISGLPTDDFFFGGFLPSSSSARKKRIDVFKNYPHTIILFETSKRFLDSIKDLRDILGNRQLSVVREITKLYEERIFTTFDKIIDEKLSFRGEIVLVIAGNTDEEVIDEVFLYNMLEDLKNSMTLKDAIKEIAESYNIPKKRLYSLSISIKKNEL